MDCEFLNVAMTFAIPKLSAPGKVTLKAAVTAIVLNADAELLDISIKGNNKLSVLITETHTSLLNERKIYFKLKKIINNFWEQSK